MSTGISCVLLVDGVRAPDGSEPDDFDGGPVVLENLAVTWGRSDTMTQPDVDTCTFDVLDTSGTGFAQVFRTGSRVDVLARGAIPGTNPIPTFTNPGFETADVTWTTSNGTAARTTHREATGSNALRFAPTDRNASAGLILAPAPFEAAGTNPDAWDDIPTTERGQTWALNVSLWIPSGAVVELRPALFTGPYSDAWAATSAPVIVTGSDEWQVIPLSYLVEFQTAAYWLGIELRYFPSARAWNAMGETRWSDIYPALTWEDFGTLYVDDAQVTSPGAESGSSVLVFSGRVTELGSAWDDSANAPVVSVTANGFTADLQNRHVGDEPWDVEDVDARAHRILTLAGLPISIDIDTSLSDTLLSWRDVDSQGALGLLQSVASSVDGVLWPAVHAALGAYLRLEDPAMRVSLLQLFEEIGPPPVVLYENKATNPDHETAGAVATTRTNLASDPAATTNATQAGKAMWAPRWFGSTGGAGTTTLVTGASDGPIPELKTYIRKTWTAAPVSNGDTGFLHMAPGNSTTVDATGGMPVTAGYSYVFSAYMRTNAAGKQAAMTAYFRNAAGAYISSGGTSTITMTPNVWHRFAFTVVAPAGAASVSVVTDVDAGSVWAVGNTLDGTGLDIETATTGLPITTQLPYFDGATPAAGDFTYAWNGTPNASASTRRAPAVVGVAAYNGAYAERWSTAVEKDTGARAVACNPIVAQSAGFIWTIGTPAMLASQWLTAIVRWKAPVGYPLVLQGRNKTGGYIGSVSLTGTGAWETATVHAQSPTDGEIIGAQLFTRSPYAANSAFYVDRMIIVVGAEPYLGPYFDGNTPDTATENYAWTGAAHASRSTQSTIQTREIIIIEADPEASLSVSACDILREPVTWVQSVADVITRASVSWKLQGVDDEGLNTTTEVTEYAIDSALEQRHGTRNATVSTELQSAADAQAVASKLIARANPSGWRASGLTIDDDDVSGDTEGITLLLELLDGTSRIGRALVIDELPAWSPAGDETGVYLEGGTYSFTGGRWVLELQASAATGLGQSAQWVEMEPGWQWTTFSPSIAWSDLRGVAGPA